MDMLNFFVVGLPLLMFAALIGYIIGMGVRERSVWVVSSGESYYTPWINHAVFTNREAAHDYANELVRLDESTRWSNCEVWEFELDRVGHVEQESVKL